MSVVSSILREETLAGRLLRGIATSPKALIGASICLLLLVAALVGPWITPQNPYDLAVLDILDSKLPPGSESMDGMVYWLGTDGQGRDMLSAMIYGLRTSIGVGVFSGVVALVIGTVLGLVAAYYGGRIDAFIMRIVDLMLGLPTILVALMLLALLGQGLWKVIFALVLVQWATFARSARSAALVEKNKDYVEAAVTLGISTPRILFGHLLPNCLPPLIVIGMLQVANAISAEATLSFLGIGLPITEPSLGLLIANGYQVLMSGEYWISVYPGLLLLVLVFSINITGDRCREILNPRLGER
ncbi:ABC transporter permease [Rhizobium sp. SSA_523]|uniref:ABC transporter permease n=1 Tax=Rhizobium sp. SSA_523 TaxID=2952477 RepID=UPI002090ADFF|nr:ABC transporter permease [Rhizobium sp. SSA_523]MCO5732494.1 ABC transporter permease [Rhizobium sp. SSA_523]WKC22366.1 ABC transporter permease [Rhizobium sp. SSA_523]